MFVIYYNLFGSVVNFYGRSINSYLKLIPFIVAVTFKRLHTYCKCSEISIFLKLNIKLILFIYDISNISFIRNINNLEHFKDGTIV